MKASEILLSLFFKINPNLIYKLISFESSCVTRSDNSALQRETTIYACKNDSLIFALVYWHLGKLKKLKSKI
jgi:hypothetical protein